MRVHRILLPSTHLNRKHADPERRDGEQEAQQPDGPDARDVVRGGQRAVRQYGRGGRGNVYGRKEKRGAKCTAGRERSVPAAVDGCFFPRICGRDMKCVPPGRTTAVQSTVRMGP